MSEKLKIKARMRPNLPLRLNNTNTPTLDFKSMTGSNPSWISFAMKFEDYVVGISSLLYLSVSVSFLIKKQYDWAGVWFSYALANFMLICASRNSM